MVSKKNIIRALVVLIALGTITSVVLWRYERQQQKAAAALAKKNKAKPRSKPVEEPAEDPPERKKEKPPKATALSPAAKDHLAEKAFISALRAAFLWRSSQPTGPETNRLLLEKLAAIPSADLPVERKDAWLSLLQAWKCLDDPAKAADPQIKAQGQRAADTLNVMLKAHGDTDITL